MKMPPSNRTIHRFLKRVPYAVWALVGAAALVSAFFIRNSLDAKESLRQGDAALENGFEDMAILHYRRSVESYTPIGKTGETALKRLIALGDAQMQEGNPDRALFAFRSARFAVLSTRHLFIPFEAYLAQIHQRIDNAASLRNPSFEKTAAKLSNFEKRLPSRWKGFLGAVAFLMWLASIPTAAVFGLKKEGGASRRLPYLAALMLVLFALWCGLLAAA